MRAKYERTTVRGILRTGYKYGPPNYGMSPTTDSFQRPIFLTLTEAIDVEPNPSTGEGDFLSTGVQGVTEVHVAPQSSKDKPGEYPDFESYMGGIVEITGDLFPAHTGHHHRPLLITCEPRDIRMVTAFALEAVDGARVFVRGSGIVVDTKGHILTADHVVQGVAYSVRRGLQRVEARVVGTHPTLDVAILQADIPPGPELSARVILAPQLGETVFACGFPLRPVFAHDLNITAGIVSNVSARPLAAITAPIQKGNSGGPVFDEFGNLLALVTSRAKSKALLEKVGGPANEGEQDGLQLLNFAIPVSAIASFLKDKGVELRDCFYMYALPDDVSPLRGTEVARRAIMHCVEVESWQQVPPSKAS